MSRAGTIARRTFLIGSVAIAGGVAFGVWKAKQPFENPLLDDLAEGEATFNAWVLIDAEKITLFGGHADKGQGVASMQAALIAEEMDLEWGNFDIAFGKPDKAYFNTALAQEAAPFMASDESRMAESVRGIMGGIMKLAMPMQMTAGRPRPPMPSRSYARPVPWRARR